jgi:hypothetical protein
MMIDSVNNASAAVGCEKTVRVKPTFAGALRGVWLFTWRSQLTSGRLPFTILALLVLPVLVHLTTSSLEGWSRRQALLGNSSVKVNDLARRLARSGSPLTPEQDAELQRIFQEEFEKGESAVRDGRPGSISVNLQREQIRDCYERISNRAKAVLDEKQYARYEEFQKRSTALTEGGVREARWGRTEPFYHWLIDFYFFVILPLNCVRACGGLIRDELQADTLGFLTTRPLSRARLLIAKYLAQTAWLQIMLGVETLLLFAVGGLRHIPSLGTLLPLFLAAQFLAVMAWSALGIFLGQATKRYMAAALLYGLVVELGIGQIPTNINNLSLIRQMKSLLAHDAALQGIYGWLAKGVPFCAGAVVLAAFIFLIAAALLFTYREYHHTVEMQK